MSCKLPHSDDRFGRLLMELNRPTWESSHVKSEVGYVQEDLAAYIIRLLADQGEG